MKMEQPFIAKDTKKETNFFSIEKDSNSILGKIEEDGDIWDEDTYDFYLQIIEKMNFIKELPQDIWELQQKILNNFLKKLQSSINIEFPGWHMDENLTKMVDYLVNLDDPKKFTGSLEILNQVENIYFDFLNDDLKPNKNKRPIQDLIENLFKKTKNENSNLFLSSYIKQISENPKFMSYSQYPAHYMVEIGENIFSNVSSRDLDWIKVSEKKDSKIIRNLIKERKKIDKEIKKLEKNVRFYDKEGEKKKDYFWNKWSEISQNINRLVNKNINDEDLIKDKSLKNENKLDVKILKMIWINSNLRGNIENQIGIKLKDFSLPEQAQIINFLKSLPNKKSKDIKSFSDKYSKTGFHTFLSVEQGGKEMRDKILALGEKLPEDVAEKVFAKYGEIINVADNVEAEINNIFGNKGVSNKVLTSTKETLLKRGAKLLSDLGEHVMDKDFKINEQVILNELEEIKAETILLGVSYVKLYKEGISVPIEDVTKTEEISTENLSEAQKMELLKIYINGRPKVTYENKDHLELLRKEFKEELNKKNISVFNIRFNGDIIIFAIVDKKDKDTLYVGGLTFVNEVRNPVIAEASMNCVLEKFKSYNIKALVDSRNPILAMYQKRFGFNIVKELPREENAGELYYEIERPKDINMVYPTEIEKKEFQKAA